MHAALKKEMGMPAWFHHHGDKMRVEKLDIAEHALTLRASAAGVRIARYGTYDGERQWLVTRWVKLSQSETDQGERVMSERRVRVAFSLEYEAPGDGHRWLFQHYGALCGAQCYFIRTGDHLNIPGPGTGHDGDPNVSIFLSEDIKDAVRQLLGS